MKESEPDILAYSVDKFVSHMASRICVCSAPTLTLRIMMVLF